MGRLAQTLGNTKPTYRKSLRASPVEYKVIGYDAQFFVEKERMQQPQHSGAYGVLASTDGQPKITKSASRQSCAAKKNRTTGAAQSCRQDNQQHLGAGTLRASASELTTRRPAIQRHCQQTRQHAYFSATFTNSQYSVA